MSGSSVNWAAGNKAKITISGTGFGADSAKFGTDVFVKIGTQSTVVGNLVSITDTSLVFTIPSATPTGAQTITLTTPFGNVSVKNTCASCVSAPARSASTTEILNFNSASNYGLFWFTNNQVVTISGFTGTNDTKNNGTGLTISATNSSGNGQITVTNTSQTTTATTSSGTVTQDKIVIS